jgi:hypothetical protein
VDVGVTIEPRLVPDAWTIIDGLDSALREYLALAKQQARRRKRPAAAKRSTTGRGAKGSAHKAGSKRNSR